MYCGGDDLNAVVCDVGCLRSRMGYAGEDDARYISTPSSDMNGIMTAEGTVASFDALEVSLDEGFARLGVESTRQHPIMWSESSFQTLLDQQQSSSKSSSDREAIAELFFEKYDAPAYFVSKSAVLTCFANGRSTGMVVEMGHGSAAVVPVTDGYVVGQHAVRHVSVGGHALDTFLRDRVLDKLERGRHQSLSPIDTSTSSVPKSTATSSSSLLSWSIIRDLKESICRTAESHFDETTNANIPQMPYELPDGTQISIGVERFSVAEHLFHHPDPSPPTSPPHQGGGIGGIYLPGLVVDAASRGDADSKKEFLQNIVLGGGSSCFESFPTRLEREILAMLPSAKLKLLAPPPNERTLSAFLGGSILASLGSFHEMWISKTEYAEHGAHLVQKKCP
ncbi:hypothetical protein H257_10617 [Aphanomyces astaci]|nr:hypothetical protein H257_10617 [Aphanomyces astaci]ETV75015.1 hypothetical protein H257_10617 [Aphanomyces astaci]|eukprot:XP_009835519.1 hypothetical protein H257_10617 [Aphanomyces astaci]